MGRLVSTGLAIAIFLGLALGLTGCAGTSPTHTTNYPVPAIITLTPANQTSIEIGGIVNFSASPRNARGSALTEPVKFETSDASIFTIAANGRGCAGTWNSLSSPTVCTPGSPGVAQVWATFRGVSSAPTMVYVHQHIDKVTISQVISVNTLNNPCLSVGQTADYAPHAYNQGVDITSSVGTVSWQTTNSTVSSITPVTDSQPIAGLVTGDARVTARVPGVTSIYAAISGINSVPVQVITCPVQSITLELNHTNATSITIPSSGSADITPTVLDTLGNTITGSFLSFNSSSSAAVTVSSTGSVSGRTSGAGAFITASCAPPSCNIGILPTLPVYASGGIHIAVSPSQSTSTSTAGVWVTTKDCDNATGCTTSVVPIKTPDFSVGDGATLPSTPNSFVFSPAGNRAYLGTDSGALGTRGLMVFAPGATGAVAQYAMAPGKVLAVSSDGNRAIISDTADTPNHVYIFTCGASSGTGSGSGGCQSPSAVTLNITGATSAAFSPDGMKAFIVSNAGSASTLYVYSTLDALETIPLSSSAPANDVAFLPAGSFGYIAGGAASGVSVVATCHDVASPGVATVATSGTPLMIRPLPDGKFMVLDPPNIDFISAQISGSGGCTYSRPYPGSSGAPFIPGTLAVSNAVTSTGLGLGNFTPSQLIVSPDASTAYITIATQSHVVVFDVLNKISTGIPLVGGATPLSASLSANGALLFVGASDGTVHVLDTTLGNDVHQVSFPTNLCPKSSTPCSPNLIATAP